MKKRLLVTVFAAIAAATCTLSFTACGENDGTKGLEYELNKDGASYSVKAGDDLPRDTKEIKIPSTYEGKPVTAICEYAFESYYELKSVTIANGLTSIGRAAFKDCQKLISINIPNSVTYIGYEVFYNCTNLADISFPDSVTYIGKSVIYRSRYYFKEDNWQGDALYNNNHLIAVKDTVSDSFEIKAGTLTIAGGVFEGNTNLTSIIIPSGVKTIGDYAFNNCTSLESVNIPNGVTEIGEGAFEHCAGIKSVTIPDGVTSISGSAFYGCASIASLTIPDSVTSIGAWAFYDCSALTSIDIPDNVTSVGVCAFNWCNKLNFSLYDNATYLGNENNPYLILIQVTNSFVESCIINENTKVISCAVFSNAQSLTSVTIPKNVTHINSFAFHDCAILTDIYYEGSEQEWANIDVDEFNESLTTATIHYNYNG